jgi:formate-dependent nitrite reductase membrane component NrfD
VEVNLKPACEIVCPEEAIISGDLDDANSKISQLISRQVVQARKPEQGTYPKLFYINADETAITPGAASTSNSYMWAEIPKEIEDRGSRIEDRRLNDGRGVADQSALSVTKNGSEGAQNKFLAKLMGEVPAVSTQHSAPSAQHAKIPLTAKTVYDVGHPKPWGGKISLYIWTKSISAGTFLLSTLLPYMNLAPRNALFRWGGPLIALIFLALTTIFLIVDLKRPDRFFYILTRPQWRSWLVLGGYSLTIYGIILSLWLIGSVFDVTSMQSVLLWPGVIFSILTTIYTGFLFGQAEGRDFWQSPLMPIHLLVQAIMAGSATLLLGSILFYGESATRALDLWMQGVLTKSLVGSLLVNIFIILVGELFMHHPNQDVQKVIHLITKGPFKFLFWVGAILIGNVLPLLLILSPSGALSLIGLLLALVGILGVLSTLSGSSMSPQKTLLKSWGYWVALIAIGLVPLTILLWGNTTMFLSIATFSAILFSLIGLLAFEHIRVMAGQSVPLS